MGAIELGYAMRWSAVGCALDGSNPPAWVRRKLMIERASRDMQDEATWERAFDALAMILPRR